MPQPTIDLTEVANGVTAILNARVHGAQLASAQAEAQREAEAQQQIAKATENARLEKIQLQTLYTQKCARIREIKAGIESRVRLREHTLPDEIATLSGQLNMLLAELPAMQSRYPFLKG